MIWVDVLSLSLSLRRNQCICSHIWGSSWRGCLRMCPLAFWVRRLVYREGVCVCVCVCVRACTHTCVYRGWGHGEPAGQGGRQTSIVHYHGNRTLRNRMETDEGRQTQMSFYRVLFRTPTCFHFDLDPCLWLVTSRNKGFSAPITMVVLNFVLIIPLVFFTVLSTIYVSLTNILFAFTCFWTLSRIILRILWITFVKRYVSEIHPCWSMYL